jgi:hypothetical protein
MATKIVKVNAELVPSIKSEELSIALAELAKEAAALPKLKQEVDAQLVTNAQEYAEMGTLLTSVRSIGKVGAFKINPFLEVAARVTNFLRGERSKHEDAAAVIANTASTKMADYKRREREAAEAEQRRINEKRRIEAEKAAAEQRKKDEAEAERQRKIREKEIKAAQEAGDLKKREADKLRKESEAQAARDREQAARDAEAAKANVQEIRVAPNTPKIAGTRGRIQYSAKVTDELLLLHAYVEAHIPLDQERALYLRQFIMANEQKLGEEARAVKDSKKLNATIPGASFTDEDKI